MVSDYKTLAHKGCKIAAQFKKIKFCLTSRIFLALVLLSASIERCFVSRTRDFFYKNAGFRMQGGQHEPDMRTNEGQMEFLLSNAG